MNFRTPARHGPCDAALRVAVAGAALLLLAGCPSPSASNGLDDDRLELLKAEPLVSRDPDPSAVHGWQNSKKVPPVRGHVTAKVLDVESSDAAERARTESAKVINELRSNGWTMYLAACIPPRPTATPSVDPTVDAVTPSPTYNTVPLLPENGDDDWLYLAFGYKTVEGVSFFAQVDGYGDILAPTRASVWLILRAPYSGETSTDLFPERPKALDRGAGCIESATPPTEFTVSGPKIAMSEHGPDPQARPVAPGFR
jgi:hypothetical protein